MYASSVMLTTTLRPPRAGDGPGLARTWIDAGRAYADRAGADVQVPEPDGLAAWFERLLLSPGDDVCVLVAERDEEVAGFVLGSLARPVPDAAKQLLRSLGQIRLVVDALAVQEEYRRLGIGTQLMDAIERWAREHGATVAFVATYIESELSVPFYTERMHYRPPTLRFRKVLT